MAAGDAKAIPQKNVALRITFPIFDADGDLVTGATGLDSEVSKDGGTFADCTNEATEIATASGMYYLDLTSTEMNADTVAIIVKTSTSGAKTTPIVLYTAARSINDLAYPTTSGRSMDVDASGGVEVGSFQAGAITAAAIATDAIDADALADGAITAGTFAAGAIDASAIAADAIGSSEFAQAAADKVWASAARTLTGFSTALAVSVWDVLAAAIGTASSIGLQLKTNIDATISSRASAADLATVGGYIDDEILDIQSRLPASLVGGKMDSHVAAVAADAITASALATDAVNEIADGILSRAISNVEGTAAFRTLAGAIAKLVNKVAIAGGTLTVYKTDDATAMGTQAVTSDAAADPITAVDTV